MTDTVVESNPEEVAVSKWPIIWKYSLIITACVFAYTLLLYYTGLAVKPGVNLVATVIFIVLLIFALRKYRRLNSGYMTYGDGAVIGIMIGVVESVLHSLLNAVYLGFVDKSILSSLSDQTLQTLKNNPALNQQQLEMVTKIYQDFVFTPTGMFVIGCFTGIIGGIVIALILAAILKKSPPVEA